MISFPSVKEIQIDRRIKVTVAYSPPFITKEKNILNLRFEDLEKGMRINEWCTQTAFCLALLFGGLILSINDIPVRRIEYDGYVDFSCETSDPINVILNDFEELCIKGVSGSLRLSKSKLAHRIDNIGMRYLDLS
ncbi:hypothetical protein HS7_16770 [Sulfolobales archaeon HS-7]|nr:hypothetical protein HS7_16770 [Sulfolobales archaeon HS-7]